MIHTLWYEIRCAAINAQRDDEFRFKLQFKNMRHAHTLSNIINSINWIDLKKSIIMMNQIVC